MSSGPGALPLDMRWRQRRYLCVLIWPSSMDGARGGGGGYVLCPREWGGWVNLWRGRKRGGGLVQNSADDLLGVMCEGASVSADGGERGARSAVAFGCAALEELDEELWLLKEEFRDCAGVLL